MKNKLNDFDETLRSVREAMAALRQAKSVRDEFECRDFKANDVVRVIAEGAEQYIVLQVRTYEPVCQIERTFPAKRREWMVSLEIELVQRAT